MSAETEQISQNTKPCRSGFYSILGAFICFIIIALLATPGVLRSATKPHRTQAISNAKQIGIALYAFHQEFGVYPNDTSVDLVNKKLPDHGHKLTGKSSNALLRQLLAAEIVPVEEIFYAKIKEAKEPDGNINPGKALQKGEVGFAYIANLPQANEPRTPILLTPLIPGTTKFDPKPFDGFAFILKIDHSVEYFYIHKDGHVYDRDGLDILSPKHPIWNGKAPDIRYPE